MVSLKINGSVAEWLKAPVLKTGEPQGFVSSNLTASAKWLSVAVRPRTFPRYSVTQAPNSMYIFPGWLRAGVRAGLYSAGVKVG